jgi:probable rRNA maturation factor
MKIRIDIQRATDEADIPANRLFRKWAKKALTDYGEDAELTIRIVGEKESTELNRKWRKKKGPTNVLSFPCADDTGIAPGLLGDIIICAPVIRREALEQGKSPESHWAHMVIHGTLHLLGYDHIKPEDAGKMENLETRLIESLGYPDPYYSQ